MKQLTRQDVLNKFSDAKCPTSVRIELTRACNLDCVHCIVSGGSPAARPELATDEILHLLDEISEAGAFHINITGGEPACRGDFLEILAAAFDRNFFVTLQTNGTLLTDEVFELLEANKKNIRQVGISLYGTQAGSHEIITRTPGSFELSLASAIRLKKAGLTVVIVSLMTKLNSNQFESLDALCKEHGFNFQFNTVITPRDNGDRSPCDLRLDESALVKLPKPWETFMDDHISDSSQIFPGAPLSSWCSMGCTLCYITSSGDVRPCSVITTPAGNIRESSFADIWRNASFLKEIRDLKVSDFECSSCSRFPRCRPCPGLAHLEHGSLTASPKEVCRIFSAFTDKDGEPI